MRNRTVATALALTFALIGLFTAGVLAQDEVEEGGWSSPAEMAVPIVDAEGVVVGFTGIGNDVQESGPKTIAIIALISGMVAGDHGIHLHETGNCDPAGEKPFTAAGGHFNPHAGMHGSHAGDLGNFTAADSGAVYFQFSSTSLTLDAGEMGLADADGTALVVHADPDDGVTDPAGNAGTRIACAVLFAPQA